MIGMMLFQACSPKRYLLPDQALLVKNKVVLEKPYLKEIKRDLPKYYRQKPNRKFMLLVNSRPYFYFMGSKGKDNWWKRIERNTLGETPVMVDTVFSNSTVNSFKSYLKSMGYYYSDITFKVDINKQQKGRVTYYVKTGKQYKIGSYDLQIADKAIYDLMQQYQKESFIRIGWGLEQSNLVKEQERIVNVLRNNGYLNMTTNFVNFDLDTNAIDGFVKLSLNIVNKDDTTVHIRYYVREVSVDIDKSVLTKEEKKDTFKLDGIKYTIGDYALNPSILGRNILLEQGDLYSLQKFNRTYSRMGDLNIFRLTNIQFKTEEVNPDSGSVDYFIRLIPSTKYTFTFEPSALTSDQNNTLTNQSRSYGIATLFQLTNRNVFRNAEIFQLSFRSSFEAQGGSSRTTFFNSTEQSLTGSIIMPRILLFPIFDKSLTFLSTRSIISASLIYELNTEYERRVITSGLNYQFIKQNITYFFSPLELSFIRSNIRDSALAAQSDGDIFLQNLFSNNFIMNNRFGFVYNNKAKAKGLSYYNVRWDAIELAGNLLSLLSKLTKEPLNEDGSENFFGVKYFQYIKSVIDFRYNTNLDVNNKTVARTILGAAVPYGNTPDFVPFERRFFIGGVNSLRAWLPRSIGPGSYNDSNNLDFSGELKLELNFEYRFNIYNRWLEGAVFTDAGNVWAIKKDPNRPGAEFAFNRFISELAWDAGVGIRFNFTVFVIRFDFAIPLRDPRLTEGSRWSVRGYQESKWFVENTNFNFGIGYPF